MSQVDDVDQLTTALVQQLAVNADVGIAILTSEGRYLFVNRVLAEAHGHPAIDHLGRPIAEILDPALTSQVEHLIAEVERTGRRVGLQMDAHGRTWEVTFVPLETEGHRAFGSVTRDVTEREIALASLGRRAAFSEAVNELSRLALMTHDLQALFEAAVALLADELEVELTKVLELRPDQGALITRADVGWSRHADGARPTVALSDAAHAGYALNVDEPVIQNFAGTRLHVERGVCSGIAARIKMQDWTWGVIAAHSTREPSFGAQEAQFVAIVANILGSAIERDHVERELERVAEQRRRLIAESLKAADRERQRIADNLHDDVLQSLLFARQECAAIPNAGEIPEIARVMASLDAATRAIRATVSHLHPVTLANADLRSTIEAIADEHSARTGAPVVAEVAADADSRFNALVVSAVRELLVNVAKHAPGARAVIRAVRSAGAVSIEVSDDGPRMDPVGLDSAVAHGHVGLASVNARVDGSGGSMEISPGPDGCGATVRITLPLP